MDIELQRARRKVAGLIDEYIESERLVCGDGSVGWHLRAIATGLLEQNVLGHGSGSPDAKLVGALFEAYRTGKSMHEFIVANGLQPPGFDPDSAAMKTAAAFSDMVARARGACGCHGCVPSVRQDYNSFQSQMGARDGTPRPSMCLAMVLLQSELGK